MSSVDCLRVLCEMCVSKGTQGSVGIRGMDSGSKMLGLQLIFLL